MLNYNNGTARLDSSRIYVLNSNGKLMAEYVKRGSTWRLDHYNIYGNDLLGKLDSLQKRYYYLTDHLGSVRVTVKDTAGVPVDSWSDYYPFGKEARGSSTSSEPKEQFTGKERDAETGLDYFGARYYNSEIGRWVSKDPLAEKYPDQSPYVYVLNNPIFNIDPDGRYVISYDGRAVTRVTHNTASMMTAMGLVPGLSLFSLGIKHMWSDPSYRPSGTDYAGAAIGGLKHGWKITNYLKNFMSSTAESALGLAEIPVSWGLAVSDEVEQQQDDQLAMDGAIFEGAEDAGVGVEYDSMEGTLHVSNSIAIGGKKVVEQKLGVVKSAVESLFKKHGFAKTYKGMLEFKAWLSKNKGSVKKIVDGKDEDEEKDRDEER